MGIVLSACARHQMSRISCSICLDDFPTTQIERTPCAHSFCRPCLAQWRSMAHGATCPMCRTDMTLKIMPASTRTTSSTLCSPRVSPVVPVTTRVSTPVVPVTTVRTPIAMRNPRDYLEREHEQRQKARERRQALEARLDRYRSSMWTPSGRPYESLPVVTPTELRTVLAQNQRNLGAAIMASRDQ